MKSNRTILSCVGLITLWLLFPPVPAQATQGHAGIEGVLIHQFAHLFFLFSMVLLIYWLRQAGLVRVPGWRYIQYAALFFILWNVDTMLVHFLDEQIQAVRVEQLGGWKIQVIAAGDRGWLSLIYYLAKLDHLLCVPAMLFLLLGLRHMLKESRQVETGEGLHR